MQILKFTVSEQILHLISPARLIIAETRQHIFAEMELDHEWDGLAVTVVFSNDFAEPYSVPLTADPVEIPPETLVTGNLRVSLVGLRDNGAYRLTTKFMDKPIIVHRAGELIGLQPEEASPELWEQVLSMIGPMQELNTADKSSLVAAINEVLQRPGGDPEFGTGNVSSAEIDTIKVIDRADYEALPRPRPAGTMYLIRG